MESLIKKLFGRYFSNSSNFENKKWKDIEYFSETWNLRIDLMAKYIVPNTFVVDFGCGPMWLKQKLPENCKYLGVDYIDRGEGSTKCDLNKKEFPTLSFDFAFVSGCLEYIEDYKWFIENISKHSNRCIISYCTTDFFSNLKERSECSWVNNLSKSDILAIFENYNWVLKDETITETNNSIFFFEKY